MFIGTLKEMIDKLEETQVVVLTLTANVEYHLYHDACITLNDGYIIVRQSETDSDISFMVKQDSIIAVTVIDNWEKYEKKILHTKVEQ